MVTSVSNVGFAPTSTNSSIVSTRFAPTEDFHNIMLKPSWQQKEEAKRIKEEIDNMEEGASITVSDPNNNPSDMIKTESKKSDKLIITKIGEDKYQVVVTNADPRVSYLVAPKQETYIVSGDELGQYIENGTSMSKKSPILCTLA